MRDIIEYSPKLIQYRSYSSSDSIRLNEDDLLDLMDALDKKDDRPSQGERETPQVGRETPQGGKGGEIIEESDDDELPPGWVYHPFDRVWEHKRSRYKTPQIRRVFKPRRFDDPYNPNNISKELQEELENEADPIDIQTELKIFDNVSTCDIGNIVYVFFEKSGKRGSILITDSTTRDSFTYFRGVLLNRRNIESTDGMFEDVIFNQRHIHSIANRWESEYELNNVQLKLKGTPNFKKSKRSVKIKN